MGYLDKSTITIDAILTNRGRELLAKGGVGETQAFQITKFAVSDDEIDYGLYNVAHPQGSEYYGSIIENMPVLEATPDEQQIMRYKLVSLGELGEDFITPSGQIIIPSITNADDVSVSNSAPNAIRPFGTDPSPANGEGYTVLVADARLVTIRRETATGTILNPAESINANGSITINIPTGVAIVFSQIVDKTGTTTATVFGDNTGATATFSITAS